MNCEELNMELCGSCKHRKGIQPELMISDGKCFIDFFHAVAQVYDESRVGMKEYILLCLNDSVFRKQHIYLRVMIHMYYTEYVGLYETIILLM